MFKFFKKKLQAFSIGRKLLGLFGRQMDAAKFEELEKLFYESDLGVVIARELTEKIKALYKQNPQAESNELLAAIKKHLLSILPPSYNLAILHHPEVIMLVGTNGSGKTSSLAKLAGYYKKQGKKVLIAAADTYRAAAVEQLGIWADRLQIPVIKSTTGADASAVVFDAIKAALARDVDVILIDTAGRLHVKTDLMQELQKIVRVVKKLIPEAPHQTLLTVDATIGQNALDQAKTFNSFAPLSGFIMTKLDGSAKGGMAICIQRELNLPIGWIGTGEGIDHFAPFEPISFIDDLLDTK